MRVWLAVGFWSSALSGGEVCRSCGRGLVHRAAEAEEPNAEGPVQPDAIEAAERHQELQEER